MGTTVIWLYEPQQSLLFDFFPNTNDASIAALSLLTYAHIYIQLNPITRKTQSTYKLDAAKSHTLGLKHLINT